MNFSTIPEDILVHVLDSIDDIRSLYSMAMVCKYFNTVFQPYLDKKIPIPRNPMVFTWYYHRFNNLPMPYIECTRYGYDRECKIWLLPLQR